LRTSELLVAGRAGMPDKKITLNDYYFNLDDVYPGQEKDEKRFRDIMGAISDSFNGELAESAFHRPPLFYTLYCVVYHHIFGLPGIQRSTPQKRLGTEEKDSLREAVIGLSDIVSQAKQPGAQVSKKHSSFVTACLRSTDKITPRKVRFNSLYDAAF